MLKGVLREICHIIKHHLSEYPIFLTLGGIIFYT